MRRTSCRPVAQTRGGASRWSLGRGRRPPGRQDAQDFGALPALRDGGRDHLRRGAANVGHRQPAQEPVEPVWHGGGAGGLTVIARTRSA